MRRIQYVSMVVVTFALGYLAGTVGLPVQSQARAQAVAAEGPPDVSEATIAKIKEARYALQEALDSLEAEGKYESITTGINSFLILSGGGNAREDLESGRGVDPETFAALHAGLAIPEIGDHMGYDEKGRLTYQNNVVRMYSISRLQQLYDQRLKFADPGL